MPVSAPLLSRAAAIFLAAACADTALAQDNADNWLTRLFQPPAANSVPAPGAAPAGTREWTGNLSGVMKKLIEIRNRSRK